MKNFKGYKVFFGLTAMCWTIFSLTFLVMPYNVSVNGNASGRNILLILTGVVFWLGLTGGWILFAVLNHMGRQYPVSDTKKNPFYSNIPTAVADTSFIAAAVVLILCGVSNTGNEYIIYVLICILSESVFAQILFGGKVYQVFVEQNKIKSKGERIHGDEK